MSVQVTMTFATVDEAIVFLGTKVAAPAASRASPAKSPESPVVGPAAATTTKRKPGRPVVPKPTVEQAAAKPAEVVKVAEPAVPITATEIVNAKPPADVAKRTEAAVEKILEPLVTAASAMLSTAYTLDDAQAAISKVFNGKGIELALQVLSRSGVKRVGELKTDQYAQFIADCTRVMEGGQP